MGDDTDDTDDSPVFGLFSSCSPQYRKVHGSRFSTSTEQEPGADPVRITTSVATTPDTPEIPDFKMKIRSSLLTPDKDFPEISPLEHRKVFNFERNCHIYNCISLIDIADFIRT